MTTKRRVRKGTTIWVSPEVKNTLRNLKHPGQTYQGVIEELIFANAVRRFEEIAAEMAQETQQGA